MSAPLLPPLLTAIEDATPLATALQRANAATTGAGELFWSPDPANIRFSVVLEPDVSAARSVEMLPLAMVASGDCLGALTPPKVAVAFRLPGTLLVNAGTAGRISINMAKANHKDDVPDWLVLSIEMALKRDKDAVEPGYQPDTTSLDEEGCETLTRNRFIESWSRHFLSWIAIWQDDGFAPVVRAWKFMAEDEKEPDLDALRQAFDLHAGTK